MLRLYAIAFACFTLVISLTITILSVRPTVPIAAAPKDTCCVRKGDSQCKPEYCYGQR